MVPFRRVRAEDERAGVEPTWGFGFFCSPEAPQTSLRGALATKQSIYPLYRDMDCFASLAMTAEKLTASRRDRRGHRQKRPRHVPEQLAVDGERDRMGGAGQDDELAVAVRQQIEEFLEVGDGGDTIIFAAH